MGEAPLVSQDAREGASLVQQLDEGDLPLTAAFWAHDTGLDVWRLVLAVSKFRATSPRAAYALVQRAITDLDLSIPLNRITIVSDTDPLIGTLREYATHAFRDLVEVPLAGADIGGAPVDIGYVYSVEAVRYEKDLFAALQRCQPEEAVLRRADQMGAFDRFGFDFVVDNGVRTLLIVAKAPPRRLTLRDVTPIVRNYEEQAGRYLRRALMIISKTGFAFDYRQMQSEFTSFDDTAITFLQWANRENDPDLRADLQRLLEIH